VFEDAGGTLVREAVLAAQRARLRLVHRADQADVDAVFLGFAGSNGFRFFKQYNEYGMKNPVLAA
jgi:branched-chain amino acid transport system substrate-binding protein